MNIVVTGGGTAGHITPLIAVAHELKQLRPDVQIDYIGQTGDVLTDITEQSANIDHVYTVRAGKWRRYHGEGIKQLLDVETMLKNLRDVFFVVAGLWQSYWLLGKLRPDLVFIKGGFVGLPVGLAAAFRRIPYVTHDSDALPGLTNRIIARWARVHAVALPKEIYSYPPSKTVTVGVPIGHDFHLVTGDERREYRERLALPQQAQVIAVTGGSQGAERLNRAVQACVPELFERYPQLYVVHIAGRLNEAQVRQQYKQALSAKEFRRVLVKGFITNMHEYSGAADVIITRAGATSIAEFAAQAKPCVVVPNPQLTGGHQLKNAQVLADRKAIKMVNEDVLNSDHHALMPALTDVLDHPDKAEALGKRLQTLAHPNATHLLAVLLLEVATGKPASEALHAA